LPVCNGAVAVARHQHGARSVTNGEGGQWVVAREWTSQCSASQLPLSRPVITYQPSCLPTKKQVFMMPFKQQRLLAICLTICNLIPQIVLLLISPRAIGEENFSLSHPGATSKEKSFLHIRPSSIYVCLRFAKKEIYIRMSRTTPDR
jgi:hypothetical protein